MDLQDFEGKFLKPNGRGYINQSTRLRRQKGKFTYIIEAEGSGYIKIGQTRDLPQRLKTLHMGCPQPIRLLRKIKGGQHERILHKRLKQFRSHAEWFEKTDELVRIVNLYERGDPDFQPIDPRPVIRVEGD